MQDLWSGSPLIYFFYAHTTIRRNYMVFFHYSFFSAWPFDQNLGSILIFFFFFFHLYTTMWPKIMVLIDLIFLFLHSHLIKNEGPHWFISFICTSPFGQITWSSFICFFFCLRPFDQKLGSTLMYFLHLYTIIWPKIRVLMNLIFLFVHNH